MKPEEARAAGHFVPTCVPTCVEIPCPFESGVKQRLAHLARAVYLGLILTGFLAVGGCQESDGSSKNTAIPTISVHPTPATVTELAPATFAVTAFSEGPLTYQWLRNGRDMAGATDSVLTIFPPRSFDASQISVRVSNSAGASISRAASLTVVAKRSGSPSLPR